MNRPATDQPLLPSVLDRLIDREPGVAAGPGPRAAAGIGELKDALRRDLEWLLNTRRPLPAPPPGARHVPGSVLGFGLPDFSTLSLENSEQREALRRTVEQAVARYEPRLTGVSVVVIDADRMRRGVRFRIEGLMRAEPAPEPVAFDSMLRLPTRDFVVEG